MAGTDHTQAPVNGGPIIILAEPQLGENIGTAARAMANFGLSELRLIRPRDDWPNDYAFKAASGADQVIEEALVFDTEREALADLHYVYATSARQRDLIKPVQSPEEAAAGMRERAGRGEKIGIMFGRERTGLENDQVTLADMLIMAPVNPAFASLNLAQAVLLIGYEWFKLAPHTLGDGSREDGPAKSGLRLTQTRPATKDELIGFYEHLETELDDAGFLYPPEKRPAMVLNIRNMFQRTQPTEQDVRTLRGIVSSLSLMRKRRRT